MLATDWIDIIEDVAQPRRESDITAWVNVIYGCNEKCSYCVVPYTRGAEKSRHPDDIVREVCEHNRVLLSAPPQKGTITFSEPTCSSTIYISTHYMRFYFHVLQARFRHVISKCRRSLQQD